MGTGGVESGAKRDGGCTIELIERAKGNKQE